VLLLQIINFTQKNKRQIIHKIPSNIKLSLTDEFKRFRQLKFRGSKDLLSLLTLVETIPLIGGTLVPFRHSRFDASQFHCVAKGVFVLAVEDRQRAVDSKVATVYFLGNRGRIPLVEIDGFGPAPILPKQQVIVVQIHDMLAAPRGIRGGVVDNFHAEGGGGRFLRSREHCGVSWNEFEVGCLLCIETKKNISVYGQDATR
jgi:hypothetical protein